MLKKIQAVMVESGQLAVKSFKGDRRRLCRSLEDGTSAYSLEFKDKEVWRNLTDKDINTMVCNCVDETEVTERAAYGRIKERRVRLASFCASTNNREFITDITGNRRWLPFEVESIQNPFHTTLPYTYLYAQAKHLVEQGWFTYWFDLQEIELLEAHNEEFRAQDNEEQLLPILFDIPAEGKGEFMTTAEISERLVTFGGIKKPMNTRQLGMLMTKKGFEKKQVYLSGSTVRGWMVYKRDTDEITLAKKIDNNYASCQPSDIY